MGGRLSTRREPAGLLMGLALLGMAATAPASAADLKEVNFSEAVHNLCYINLRR